MANEKKYWGNSRTFGIILKVLWVLILLLAIFSLVRSCSECTYQARIVEKTGYLPENEDWDNIPDVQPPYDDDDTLNLPEKVLLEQFFPPIGDQGDKGTCVAWAVGYNLKTALNAIDNHWTQTELAQASHQTSPKDLWLSIPQQHRGSSCSGTSFEPAFSVLMTAGAASMEKVPYKNMKSCNGVGVGDTNNRISSFYHVVDNGGLPKLGQIKAYICDTIPLVIGARLGDSFMKWNNDDIIKSDTYNHTGMHAYHAMVVVGYDDGRNAFRLRNSWGTSWGDEGSIWVDYGFFFSELCDEVFIAKNYSVNK